jgi:Protein of unknown function (DUF3102)
MSRTVRKTRAQWAAEISAAHQQSIEGILKMGRTLIAAKKALSHGEFTKMIDRDLPFDTSTAQRLMKIARDPRLRKAARVQLLPRAWSALYELTKLSDATFKQAISSGAINPQMTRNEARTVRVVSHPVRIVTPRTVRVLSHIVRTPYYVKKMEPITVVPRYKEAFTMVSPPADAPSSTDVSSLALPQIERLVEELAMAIQRGDVRLDAVSEGRIRAIADRLLSVIADDVDNG